MAARRNSRTDYAYRHLSEEILSGRWQAGDILSTYALAEELKVSRTPVLEALKRLESEGLVEIIPQVGCRIVGATPGALEELYAGRAALEGVAAAAAARKADADALDELEILLRRLAEKAASGDHGAYAELNHRFHLRIADAAGMPRLADAQRSLWASLRYQLARLAVSNEQIGGSEAEHRDLYEALRRGMPRRARVAAERHARLSAARFIAETGPRTPDLLRHRALVYGDDEAFLSATVPFIEGGLDEERVLAVTTARNAELLGRAMGRRADEVEFRNSDEWYVLPSHTMLSYERYIEEADRSRVRILGEVGWNGSAAPVDEWTRYESILNVAFALQPATFLCPYDARELPAHVTAGALRTHPELCHGTDATTSDAFVPVPTLIRELDSSGFPEPGGEAAELPIMRDMREVRGFILEQAKRAGVSGKAIQDAFLAVQEVTTNAVAQGAGRGLLRAWREDGELIYEVRDDGSEIGDPLIGQLASDPALTSEPRGLWMARLLCDLVEVRAHDRGLIVRLHVALG